MLLFALTTFLRFSGTAGGRDRGVGIPEAARARASMTNRGLTSAPEVANPNSRILLESQEEPVCCPTNSAYDCPTGTKDLCYKNIDANGLQLVGETRDARMSDYQMLELITNCGSLCDPRLCAENMPIESVDAYPFLDMLFDDPDYTDPIVGENCSQWLTWGQNFDASMNGCMYYDNHKSIDPLLRDGYNAFRDENGKGGYMTDDQVNERMEREEKRNVANPTPQTTPHSCSRSTLLVPTLARLCRTRMQSTSSLTTLM